MILWTYADTNTILGKVTNQINQEEDLLLKTLYHAHNNKRTKGTKDVATFYQKDFQKTNQTEFSVEKV